jgi:hypothetical protein
LMYLRAESIFRGMSFLMKPFSHLLPFILVPAPVIPQTSFFFLPQIQGILILLIRLMILLYLFCLLTLLCSRSSQGPVLLQDHARNRTMPMVHRVHQNIFPACRQCL